MMAQSAAPMRRGSYQVRIVPRRELMFVPDGPTRGFAHVAFESHPSDAPGHLDFEPLILVAEGELRPGEEVPMHRHENIENLTLVLEGEVCHRDSLGNRCAVGPREASLLSAGAGIEHAEAVVGDAPVRALVIWLRPSERGGAPAFHRAGLRRARDQLELLATSKPISTALRLDCDASVYMGVLGRGRTVVHELSHGRRGYLMPLDGMIEVDGCRAHPGDRVLVEGQGLLSIVALESTEVVLIDVT
jgi:quercetin 2,3-dioxygenase